MAFYQAADGSQIVKDLSMESKAKITRSGETKFVNPHFTLLSQSQLEKKRRDAAKAAKTSGKKIFMETVDTFNSQQPKITMIDQKSSSSPGRIDEKSIAGILSQTKLGAQGDMSS